ncbi:MAG: glycosyl hydrolase family 95 catalytic domain-containing protein [Prevotella sp.]
MKQTAITLLLTLISLCTTAQDMPLKLWYDRPADFFEESIPIGNGKLGALIYGGTDTNIIHLNDITMWTGQPVDHNEDAGASRWIPEIRKALFNEDYALADSLQLNVQGHNSQFYQPLLTMQIEDIEQTRPRGRALVSTPTSYYRELDLNQAICRDRYTLNGVTYDREYFASNPDKVIAIKLRSSKTGMVNCRITISGKTPHAAKATASQLTITGHATGDEMHSIHFCSILKASVDMGEVHAEDSTITILGATTATIYFVNQTSFNGYDKHPVKQGAEYLANAADDAWHLVNFSYEQLRNRHVSDYVDLFGRFKLRLGNAVYDDKRTTSQQLLDYSNNKGGNTYLETLYTQYGRYLLISCSRTPSVPANLQGLWTPHLWSPWRGNYTVNINLEENYWPAEIANLSELTEPLDGFIRGLAANGAFTAKNYYGINRGWCSSHNSDIWAMTNPVGEKNEKPEWANWNLGGAWLVNALWEHYLYTMDLDYLKTVAYPLMKGAAEFCLDWLIENPKKPGELITAPSTSPENEYKTTDGYHGMTCYGGTADLAIIRELFKNTLAAAATMGCDDELQRQIKEATEKLHPYTIGSRGNLQEWYYDWEDWDWQHRHQSHLIGLYPGTHITASQPELLKACEKTLEIKGDYTTGWSTGWRINLWARLGKAKEAYNIFQKLLTYVSPDGYQGPDRRHSGGTYPNLFDAHPPFQIDGNFGGTAGVCEMLLQSDGSTITLLPALPAEWSEGKVSGICARGGHTVNMTWSNGQVTELSIKSRCDGKVNIVVNGKTKTIKTKADTVQRII